MYRGQDIHLADGEAGEAGKDWLQDISSAVNTALTNGSEMIGQLFHLPNGALCPNTDGVT